MSGWFLPRRRIGTRLAAAVTVAMTVVLLGAGAFVYWRVSFALDRQVDSDLRAYAEVVARAVHQGQELPHDTLGQASVVYDASGNVLASSRDDLPRLAGPRTITRVLAQGPEVLDLGRLLPASPQPYRVRIFPVSSRAGRVVVASAISRAHHDEALRELAVQLVITDLLAIAAAALVGIGVSRAALGPVEGYRRAVVGFGDDPRGRLPVDASRDDELSRLGHTFNDLLDRLSAGHERERGFLADASHELRSPLAMLATEIEWATHRPRSAAEMAGVLASLREQVTRLVELSDALLDFEELRSEELVREPTDLRSVVEDAIAPHRRAAEAGGRAIVTGVPEATVPVDPRRLELAVGNLVGNALKHGRGTVTVTARDGDPVVIRVVDEGPGVDPALGDRAFDRFTRAEGSRTTRGNGLGLALVQGVALSHGGRARLVPGGVELELPRPP